MINLYLGDCLEAMSSMENNSYDLAIVDPPYGGGQNYNFRFKEVYTNKSPSADYFKEVQRVSKNWLIWGATYFTDKLPVMNHWICWQKGQPIDSFSDFELCGTSFTKTDKTVKLDSYGFNHADRRHGNGSTIHPTQKPIALYKWLLTNYAKEGDKILDTHGGSMSIALACHDLGYSLDLWEIDEDYYNAGVKRYNQHIAQLQLFGT